jgi:hypothetical protein
MSGSNPNAEIPNISQFNLLIHVEVDAKACRQRIGIDLPTLLEPWQQCTS